MIRILTLLACLALATTTSAQTTLRYKWKAGATYRFKAEQVDEVKMGGALDGGMMSLAGMGGAMGMAGNLRFKTSSVFALRITKTTPEGGAAGVFNLENFRVTDGTGRAVATLANIPKGTLTAPFTVDELGNFDFSRIPVLICDQETGLAYLTISGVEPGEQASAEMVVDGERVKLYAEFTKGGQLKAGYTAATIGQPKTKTMEVQEDDEVLDLIPTDFLDMFVLPEEEVQAGRKVRLAAAGTEQTFTVAALQGNTATLNTRIGSAMSAAGMKAMGDNAARAAGDEPEPMEEGEEIPTVATQTSADITTTFDNGLGMFHGMKGTTATQMNMMGMEVNHTGTLQMTALP